MCSPVDRHKPFVIRSSFFGVRRTCAYI
jgi:hypothetical protein